MSENCRVCLSDSSLIGFKSLTDTRDNQVLLDLLSFLSGIEIKIEQELPARICSSCLDRLVAATDLKQQILDTEKVLSEKFKEEVNSVPEEVEQLHSLSSMLDPIEQVIVEEPSFHQRNKDTSSSIEKKNKRPNLLDYKCHICQVSFNKVGAKNLHVKNDHSDESHCQICNKKCKTPLSLETHIKFHFKDYEFMCEVCSKTFRYSNRLEIHMKLHHSESSMFACDLCGLTTKFKNNVKRHMNAVHMKLRLFKCDKCSGLEYSTQEALNGHFYRCHGVPAPAKCLKCSTGFSSPSEHRLHEIQARCSEITFAPFKKRQIPDCDYLEVGSSSEIICKVCVEAFPTRDKAKTHFYLKHKHSNKCEECNIVFNNFPALTRHRKVKHEGHKPFKCDICQKCFGQKVSLVSHKNSHTKEKPFSCSHCPYRSGDYSSISKHKKKVHPETCSSK